MMRIEHGLSAFDPGQLIAVIESVYPGAGVAVDGVSVYVDLPEAEREAVAALIGNHKTLYAVPASRQTGKLRDDLAAAAMARVESSPLARAILEDRELSGWTLEEIVAEQGRLLRLLFAALGDEIVWPDWAREARP